jgi:hypothetical protein
MRYVLVVLACLFSAFQFPSPVTADESVLSRIEEVVVRTSSGETSFIAEIADTPELRSRGLMFRHRLPEDRAMLFDFKETRNVMMWMKNTHVSLDMVFIRPDGIVAKIAERTTPMSETVIDSGVPVAFVLELAAGTAKRIGLVEGDRVIHPLIGTTMGSN